MEAECHNFKMDHFTSSRSITFLLRTPIGPVHIEPEYHTFTPGTNRTSSYRAGVSHFYSGYQSDKFISNRSITFLLRVPIGPVHIEPEYDIFTPGTNRTTSLSNRSMTFLLRIPIGQVHTGPEYDIFTPDTNRTSSYRTGV